MERSVEADVVQGGHSLDPSGGVVPPIQPSTTFARDNNYELASGYVYSREGAPNQRAVEEAAARLDSGADARVFASGLAAFNALVETVPNGGVVVAPEVMYHGGQLWLRRLDESKRIDLTLFDQSRPGDMKEAIERTSPDLVWIETPVNPTWDVIDIRAAAQAAHGVGSLLAVDSTVAPLTTRPIELGADYAFHSATKFYNGHADLLGGILVTATKDERWDEITWIRTHTGAVMGAFEAWLLLRGMKTLYLRVDRASASAMAIARHLEEHTSIEAVLYPGLESHPGHGVAKAQMDRGYGAMLSLLVNGGFDAAHRVATSTEVFIPATSLGGVESLIEHRTVLEPPESVVPDNLLRLSVGIEPVDELIADLEQALA
ncbi:MAG: PLP-dependent aspartate aminotransferase family protein [Acidimicrobiia bacterium]